MKQFQTKGRKLMSEKLEVNLDNLTNSEREQLLALVKKSQKKSKVWKPKEDEIYFYIGRSGDIHSCVWKNTEFDELTYSFGNCFKSQCEAEFAVEKQKVTTELKRYAEEHNEGEIYWRETLQRKYTLTYSYLNEKICIAHDDCTKIDAIFFTSKEIAKNAIKTIGEDRLKKYYFEVGE